MVRDIKTTVQVLRFLDLLSHGLPQLDICHSIVVLIVMGCLKATCHRSSGIKSGVSEMLIFTAQLPSGSAAMQLTRGNRLYSSYVR